jgi:GTP-binding protein Era
LREEINQKRKQGYKRGNIMKKTGFIAIVGRPNVGKSTLLNAILGEKVAIVSSKPQTTRNKIVGIHTVKENQYVFLDTPGIHAPKNSLGEYMVKTADTSMRDADAVVLVVDVTKEHIAVKEAKRLGIPVYGIVDTNSNPNEVDFVIPANDDATKSVEVIMSALCAAIKEGLDERKVEKEENETAEAPEQKKERKKVAKKAKLDGDAINAKVASKFETPEE